jgi:hypothetical protein
MKIKPYLGIYTYFFLKAIVSLLSRLVDLWRSQDRNSMTWHSHTISKPCIRVFNAHPWGGMSIFFA